jgi:Peptidase family M1 domain
MCWIVALLGACGTAAASPPTKAPPPYPPGSLPALHVPGPLSPRIANYRIDAKLDADKHRITATETLTWKHTGNAAVSSLPFHLYMNAFKNDATVFMKESHGSHRRQKAGKNTWGWIDVSSIKLGDAELRPQGKYGEDETTLEMPLPAPVEPGAEVTLSFSFTVQLPQVFARTGYMGDFIMVGQWFPKIGVLEVRDGQQAWHCDTFHLNSEFFADFGSYDVTLDVPATHTIAATGVLQTLEAAGERKKMTWHAEDVHDFAWMADPHMQVAQGQTKDGVKIFVYHRPEQAAFAARHIEAARRTIETFGRLFYPYPWSAMTIIDPPPDADQGAGGMEYPTLVTSGGDRWFTPAGVYIPEFVTIHEVGHNWFQGLLASNEVDEAWLDEGMNEYADGIVADEWNGADASMLGWGGLRFGHYEARRLGYNAESDVAPIATRSYEFPDFGAYGEQTYGKTTLVMKTLENTVGRDRFFAALGAYAQKWAFKHPTRRDLFESLNAALGEDVSWFLRPAVEGVGPVGLRVLGLSTRKQHPPRGVFGEGDARKTVDEKAAPEADTWVSEVTVGNTGSVPARVDVRFVFDDGSEKRERWDDAKEWRWKKFVLEGKHPVVEVEIDPDHRVMLEYERLDNAMSELGKSAAAWRAGARAGFWEQTILQIVGF